MGTTLPAFTPVEKSLYLTLGGRALDSRSPHPVLNDPTAEAIAAKIGYDPATTSVVTSQVRDIALRAKKLDEVVRRFVGQHPDAVVLDLGAGLDDRCSRVRPPSTVDWYDVDLPGVTAVRREVVAPRANVHALAADLTDPEWLAGVPADRPAVIVADGLVAFLGEADFAALLKRLTSHFPAGEVAFNGYTRFHLWAIKHYRGTGSIAGVVRHPGFDDPREPERWDPDLTLVEEILLARAPEVAGYPAAIRWFTRLAALSTAVSRRGTTVLRYRF
ncbi:class I SAM-dependent methyltransferase [Amycolatopsis sp. RTGN1]|uniref:class I SAM-dependent methyltransferase n=1 Tax=Amycolatopsis ponsaeliensis TaxID=2992142 RepID=UPI00254C23CE|nr:class I SAM-dependent methyltransferase [Amycolatopsis sp. RTGN1]